MIQRREWAYPEGKTAVQGNAMKRGLLILGVLIIAGLLLFALYNAGQNRQQADRASAWLAVQSYCVARVYRDAESCRAWSASVMNSGSTDYAAIVACDGAGDFAGCLVRHGFHLPPS